MKDPEKLKRIAKEWGVETEGKDIYTLAHEMAELALMEYGKPFGVSRWLSRAPEHTRKLWHEAGIEPRAIDREVSTPVWRRGTSTSRSPTWICPWPFASAFEGEIIRRGDMQVEFDGSRVDGLELVRSKA